MIESGLGFVDGAVPLFGVAREIIERNGAESETNLLSLSYGRIVRKDIRSNQGLLPESFGTYQIVGPGDIVLRLTDLQNDQRSLRTGFVRERGIITSAYLALRPRGIEPRFLAYALYAHDVGKSFYALGGGLRQSVRFDEVRRLPIPFPVVATQRRIADFLDDQVARIDRVIAARQSQITNVGDEIRSKYATMVQNLIATHSMTRLSRFLDRIEQGSSPDGDAVPAARGEFGVLKTSAIQQGGFKASENKLLPMTDFKLRYEIRDGDVLVVRGSGSADLVADVAEVRLSPDCGRLMLSDLTYRLVGLRLLPSFATAILRSAPLRAQIRAAVRQGSGPAKARGEDIVGLMIPVLDSVEQASFSQSYWSDRQAGGDRIAAMRASINLLNELRRSLIASAITGEFDVASANGSRVPA